MRGSFANAPSLGLIVRLRSFKRMSDRRVKLALKVDLTRMLSLEESKVAIEAEDGLLALIFLLLDHYARLELELILQVFLLLRHNFVRVDTVVRLAHFLFTKHVYPVRFG